MGTRTKREKASLNSETCSSVSESACCHRDVSGLLVSLVSRALASVESFSQPAAGYSEALWGADSVIPLLRGLISRK